jgi:hypothetical protein
MAPAALGEVRYEAQSDRGGLLALACAYSTHADVQAGQAPEAAQALERPEAVEVYSLEPTIRSPHQRRSLHGFDVLGHASLSGTEVNAIAAFRSAMNNPTTVTVGGKREVVVAACFEPRHAITVRLGRHRFDYLLCYSCGEMEVFRDGKMISSVPAGGSPDALNRLMRANGLPLSKTSTV